MLELRAAALEQQARRATEPLVRAVEPAPLALEAPAGSPLEAGARAVEPLQQLRQVRDDEPAGDARGGGANVSGQVAERRVLLVADRAHDGNRAVGDRPHEPLVAEGQQVLKAPAASRHDDHVDAFAAERAESLDHRAGARGPWT